MTGNPSIATEAHPKPGRKSRKSAAVGRLLELVWSYRAGCVWVLCMQLMVVFLTLVGLGILGFGVDVVHSMADPEVTPPKWPMGLAPPVEWSQWMVVAVLAITILVAAILRAGIQYAYTVSVAKLVQERLVVEMRSRLFSKLLELSFGFFDRNASGTIINRVTGDVQMVRMFVDGVLLPLVTLAVSFLFYAGYMFSLHAPLAMACLAPIPILLLVAVLFAAIVRPAYRQNRRLLDTLILKLSEALQGVAVIKGFGREKETARQFADANRHVKDQQFWIFRWVAIFSPSVTFLTQFSLVILLMYGGWLVMRGEFPLGTGLVVFAGLLQQLSMQVGSVAGITNTMQRSLVSAGRVFEVFDTPAEIQNSRNPIRLPRATGAVRFENVHSAYQPGNTVLRGVDLDVRPGQCVALLGATGAGKSALLSLLPRFYDPMEGRVLLDEVDVRKIDLVDLRRNIGIVFQESFLFRLSIAENIAFGQPDAPREKVEQAAKLAAAHEFIMRMPRGYDSVLGEGGVDLSGGQRQRIAIARAILLDPPLLILDDPTASLDPQTEHEIMEAMSSAMRGRTTFVVAHRLSTLRRADRIVVLDQGKIVQLGTHEELQAQGGLYGLAIDSQLPDWRAGSSRTGGPA